MSDTQESGRSDAASLVLISFLGLFYELAFIRWLPANVLSLAYFSNIVLISCFLGFGLGCLLSPRKSIFDCFPVSLLLITAAFMYFHRLEVITPTGGNEWIWSGYRGNKLYRPELQLGVVPVLVIVFILNALLFVPIGQMMGQLMDRFSPIKAYSLNILGSLLGVAGFFLVSCIGGWLNSPASWFGIAGLGSLWFFRKKRAWLISAVVCVAAVCAMVGYRARTEIWSPYYSMQLRAQENDDFSLYVNSFFHQRAINFESARAARRRYGIPYEMWKPKSVLVLGAGTGNDVAVALMGGATEVDAVEIDPVIARLGKEHHPSKPYSSPGVNVIVDDARSFLRRTSKKYDMVVFGTLDSHALLSGKSTLRLDNFVYTTECFKEARKHLNERGVAVLMFSVPVKWIQGKLLRMALEVFDDPQPLYFSDDSQFLFSLMIMAGPGLADEPPGNPEYLKLFRPIEPSPDAGRTPTDDWPYLYLKERAIPGYYLQTIAILVVLSVLAIWRILPKENRSFDFNFFALGCAFLLLASSRKAQPRAKKLKSKERFSFGRIRQMASTESTTRIAMVCR